MQYQNLIEVSQAALEVVQGMLLPILGACLAVSIVFVILQLVLSLQDMNLQFLLRLVLLVSLCAFLGKNASEKFMSFTKTLYESAPALVR